MPVFRAPGTGIDRYGVVVSGYGVNVSFAKHPRVTFESDGNVAGAQTLVPFAFAYTKSPSVIEHAPAPADAAVGHETAVGVCVRTPPETDHVPVTSSSSNVPAVAPAVKMYVVHVPSLFGL